MIIKPALSSFLHFAIELIMVLVVAAVFGLMIFNAFSTRLTLIP